jgi:hypothetical protein
MRRFCPVYPVEHLGRSCHWRWSRLAHVHLPLCAVETKASPQQVKCNVVCATHEPTACTCFYATATRFGYCIQPAGFTNISLSYMLLLRIIYIIVQFSYVLVNTARTPWRWLNIIAETRGSRIKRRASSWFMLHSTGVPCILASHFWMRGCRIAQ